MFTKTYGPGKFELIEVPDFSTPGAFNAAVKGKCIRSPSKLDNTAKASTFRCPWSYSYGSRHKP